MKIQLLRHATALLELEGKKLLLDPMLAPKAAYPPVKATPNPRNNPLVDLPTSTEHLQECIRSLDAALVTHTHNDHFDKTAEEILPRNLPLLCQPKDSSKLSGFGFTDVIPVRGTMNWGGLKLTRTGGHHGRGVVGKMMAPVSGYVIQSTNEPCIYIPGDTIWCREVEKALDTFHPDVILLFAGAARFINSCPITMDTGDIDRVCEKAPQSKIIVVHMEALNHCVLTREALKTHIRSKGLQSRVTIPADGEKLDL